MAEILGVGLTHYPPLCGTDEDMAWVLRRTLEDPSIPEDAKDPRSWPEAMRAEWGDDAGVRAAARHRAELIEALARCRQEIDRFEPDVIIMFGDDQYENFREDVIPPFAVLAYDDVIARPWADAQESSAMTKRQNIWGEAPDTEFHIRGHREVALAVVEGLLEREIDVAYAYRQLHHPSLSHAFLNAVLFLDYERRGFPHPVVPIAVNCYGRAVVSRRGFLAPFDPPLPPDPPSPTPRRMMQVGAAIADVVADSSWKVALIASSSWSHAFLCDKTWRLRPDRDADRQLYEAMVAADYSSLASRAVAELEDAGQQEVLNWYPLFGAMQRLGHVPTWTHMVETYVFNSNKVFAVFGDEAAG